MRDAITWIVGVLLVVAVVYAFSRFADQRMQDVGQENTSNLVGKPAPDFEGDFAVNGNPIKLSSLKGKVVLVDFWATWCKPCIDTFPHLRQWDGDYKKDGLEIVGITMYNMPESKRRDEQTLLKDFAKKHQLSHLLMTMPDDGYRQACADYHIKFYPTVALIDRKGIVRFFLVGGGESNAIESEIRKLLAEKV